MQQIIAMGGGGFSMEPENPLLDQYILAQARQSHPRVCFVGTASGDSLVYQFNFYSALSKLDCQPSHLNLFDPPPNMESFLLQKDVIYVGGGNTKSLLAVWREWDLPRILRQAWEEGVVLAGISAGANCWFAQSVTDSIPGKLTVLPGLGFLSGSVCPHFDGEVERRPSYRRMVTAGEISAGYGVDDGAALHFIGTELTKVISSRPKAQAYHLSATDGVLTETTLAAHYLGAH